jgi:hypothetical protein
VLVRPTWLIPSIEVAVFTFALAWVALRADTLLTPPAAAEAALPQATPLPRDAAFQEYWYGGLAEMNRYALDQGRYGDSHPGEAVLIFVTEAFLTGDQVKKERRDGGEAVSVLKLNAYRRFFTGVYPYTLMTSVFTPVRGAGPRSLKLSNTVQEWCGNSYTQINRRNRQLEGHQHSYFQGETDLEFALDEALLEDELFTLARLEPHRLPLGDLSIVPALHDQRFAHRDAGVRQAVARLEVLDGDRWHYEVAYRDIDRTLVLTIEQDFPHRILAWEEHPWGLDGSSDRPSTRAVLVDSTQLDYWNHNGSEGRGAWPTGS